MITVRFSQRLLDHLESFQHDGATVASALFEGGRLSYPGRRELEYELGEPEPYTLQHEARVIDGLAPRVTASIRVLGKTLRRWHQLAGDLDPTLELLWAAHESHAYVTGEVSLDRLVAALTMVQSLSERGPSGDPFEMALVDAGLALLTGLESQGFFPSSESLEELFDGAPPACVGLGMIDIDWKREDS